MALRSPRFTSSSTLRAVDGNRGVLRHGANGRAVHLVQMALLDLGYAMPLSTSNASYSPDGDYGNETRDAVKRFQSDNHLSDDGEVGPLTLRLLDTRFAGFQHRVRLHFRSIALTTVPFERSLSNAETVFGQYGIQIDFGSGESIGLDPAQRLLFDRIDQQCTWSLNDGEFNQLQALGSRAPANEILVYHVNSFANANVLGCGGHANNRPACTITANALAWDTAHEVGHVLLTSSFRPVHVNDRRNLMHPISRSLPSIPVLTRAQVLQIRGSVCCAAV